jgi:hypothetical protein
MKPWTMWRLLTTIQANQILFPSFFAIEDGKVDRLIDEIEQDLKESVAQVGLPYIRPEVGPGCVQLIYRSYGVFINRYRNEVRKVCRSGVCSVSL